LTAFPLKHLNDFKLKTSDFLACLSQANFKVFLDIFFYLVIFMFFLNHIYLILE